MDLIDRDAAAYDLVVAAYRLPKATDEDKAARKAAIRDAMRVATDVPIETARAAAALVAHGPDRRRARQPEREERRGGGRAAGDDGAAPARWPTSRSISTASATRPMPRRVRAELRRLMMDSGESHSGRSYEALGWKGHTPPRN